MGKVQFDRFTGILFAFCFGLTSWMLYRMSGEPLSFPDNYFKTAKTSLFNLSLYTADRPFTIYLFYKLMAYQSDLIVLGQKLLSAFSWTFLGYAVGRTLSLRTLALLMIPLFALVALSWNIAGWNRALLTESLAFSLFALWYGCLLIFERHRHILAFYALCTVSFLFSFTRDHLAYFLLSFALLQLTLHWLAKKRNHIKSWLIFAAFAVLVFLLQSVSSHVGKRHQFPLINVFLQRVVPDSERADWFQKRGAPIESLLDAPVAWGGAFASSHDWALYRQPRYQPFRQWILSTAKADYAWYLITHPGYTLGTAWMSRSQIYSAHLHDYTGPPPDQALTKVAGAIWNPTNVPFILSALALFAFGCWRWPITKFPLLIAICALGNGIFIFHADAMEIPRHGLFVPVALATTAVHGLALFIDRFVLKLAGKQDSM